MPSLRLKLNLKFLMKIKIQHLFSLLTVFAGIHQASAQGTAFTYEGQLNRSGSPANGNYDFTFALFNNSSTNSGQVGNRLTNLDVGVTNGLFTVTMNFGAVFTGNATWLAIGVRSNGGSSFTALSPLQELTPTPYAIYAPNAGSAASANSVAATNITGPIALAQLPAGLVTNNETNVTLGNVTLSGQFNGSGTFSNIWTPTYENYVAPYPIDRSGPDTWNTWAYSGSDWGLYDGSYGTNSEQWLTNAILAMAGVSNNAAFNKTYRTIWLTDGTFQGLDVNGNLTNDSRVFTHSWPFYTGLAHSNNAKLVVYLSFATNTCGGFPVGGLGHLYKDITNLMTWGFDGAQIDDCYFTTGGDYLGTPPYYDACMKQMNQAIVDYTASHTNAQGFSLMLTMYGGDSSWGSVLPSQFFGAQTLGSPAPIYGSTALDMAAALYYTQNYPWLTGYGHNMQLDSFYGVPQYNTADTSSNLFAISAMTHQQIRFSYGCTGKYNCPPTINSFSAYSGFFNEYLLNPTFLQIWNDNVAMPTFLTYTNTNTYILQEPLGSLNSSNHAVLIVNLNMGTGQDAVIPVNVANFNGCSNTSYVATEVFSGSVIATFTNQFTYDAGTNTCTLMTVCPNSQVLSGIQQINLPTPSGFSSSIVQNSLLTTGIGPNLVISGFQGLELDGQDYGVTVNDNFTVAPGFAITGTILAADIPAGISNAAYATNAGKAGSGHQCCSRHQYDQRDGE